MLKNVKVMSVVGTRPQFIKLAPMISSLDKYFQHITVDSGQHYSHNLSSTVIRDFDKSRIDFNLKIGNQGGLRQITRIMESLDDLLEVEKPDHILVYGDTNTTLASSLTALKRNISLSHIEAGLRTGNFLMPEEQNRILVDHMSRFLFAPNKKAMDNLFAEGLQDRSKLAGDLAVEALISIAENSDDITAPGDYLLCTIHRAENTDRGSRLQEIFDKMKDSKTQIRLFAHPRLIRKIREHEISVPGTVSIFDPLGYRDFISEVKNSLGVITDSGGLQKDAYVLGKPTLTVRSETEWQDTLISGWNILDPDLIHISRNWWDYSKGERTMEIFGPENPSQIISEFLHKALNA